MVRLNELLNRRSYIRNLVNNVQKELCSRGFRPRPFTMGRIVGIDLGTTNSLVAYIDPQTERRSVFRGRMAARYVPRS